jgi:CubicO group peptidase (beta-lactamase class C family)
MFPLLVALLLAPSDDSGMDRARLDALRDRLAAKRTDSFLVMRRGRVAYEWYAPEWNAAKPHGAASLSKSLVGGLSLLLALNDGKAGLDDPASKWIPEWRSDARKSRITLRQLATHSSGIEDAEQDGLPHDKLTGWKGAFWRRDPDPFSIALRDAPALFPPGGSWHYSNPGFAALAYAVTAATGQDLRTLLSARIYAPAGLKEEEWSIGYGRAYEVNSLKLYANWGGGSFSARAAARLGLFMLDRGEGLVAREWAERLVAYSGTPVPPRSAIGPAPAPALGWYNNRDGIWEGVPRDAFLGAGAGHQVLLVVPTLDLVAVRNGQALELPAGSANFWEPLYRDFVRPLIDAVTDLAPYPPSPAVGEAWFAPADTVVRQAAESDNWPITLGDDGHQYTAYGDGWGFEPRAEHKLSLGLSRVEGPPERFRGSNILSLSRERTGDGKAGLKASGLLMLNGVLYMWVRNAGNAQLAWSGDRGKTWTWGWKLQDGFGSPTFLQGSRDNYVYTISQDGPSAYESDDRLVLARVLKGKVRDRAAWEFLQSLSDGGFPTWTADIARRGAVFRYPRRCQRTDFAFNPGLNRYLLTVAYNHDGGWGIFDAPDPWGPWTTVFSTEQWDQGGTHGYRIPTKWMSGDGRNLWVVFSGSGKNDAFCVRMLKLLPR